jgi:hypothetical protein
MIGENNERISYSSEACRFDVWTVFDQSGTFRECPDIGWRIKEVAGGNL